ncbi:IS3 family transposase [Pseudomonas sp. RTC3]|uniref:IS3 family transposase n=1 Tax=unclassified Pseudomonas TaxID=196821 RepID=UPI002AB41375|nr:IS3 family transposase [Pseudomonas sp. 5C2]MDY7564590.1 IS3 family transposase [Pseudomonas sp. 5C2]MEB0060764.1 IS3 family transposase [Pseudomonas sp. RTC3]MEB0240410.1 IS3 family transposase [Pseudomonas sp. 5C2]
MYSYEDRIRAIKLYIKLGKHTGATIRQLGYPARDSLRAWIHQLHPELHTRVIGRSDGLAWPPAMKQAGVIALCTRQESTNAVAQKLGVCRPTLYNWKNQLLGPEASASMKRRQKTPSSPEREELQRQLESLRLDVRRLQLEHDLLMKANELIKKDTGIDRQVLTNREKTLLADALRPTYSLSELLEALGLARSSYVYHRARMQVAEKYTEVRRAMADIFERNHRCYGYRRMRVSLSRQRVRLSEKVVQRLNAKLIRSMSRKGCSPDNAACEGFFGRLKTERFYPRNWQSTSIEQFIQALDLYIRWYNEKRIKISLGALSPVEYRESLGLAA